MSAPNPPQTPPAWTPAPAASFTPTRPQGWPRVLLARHGQTAWNCDRRIQGQLDIPLNSEGLRQAELLAARLSRVKLAAVYCSDLSRALATAEPVARSQGLHPEPLPAWRELSFGCWQGLSWEEIEERYPGQREAYLRDLAHMRPEGGESYQDLAVRVRSALELILAQHCHEPGETVLVVTHAGPLRVALSLALGLDLAYNRRFVAANTALSAIEFHPGGPRLVRYNDTRHLEESFGS